MNHNLHIIFDLVSTDGENYTDKIIPAYVPDVLSAWLHKSYDFTKEHIDEYRHDEFEINDLENKTFIDVLGILSSRLGFEIQQVLLCRSLLYVYIDDELVRITNYSFKLIDFLKLYKENDIIHLLFVFSQTQGVVFRENGMSFFIYPNEQGHNTPHVHVKINQQYNASISLIDGEVLAGELPPKAHRKVKTIVLEQQKNLLDCWNKNTNGLSVNIDLSVFHKGRLEITSILSRT